MGDDAFYRGGSADGRAEGRKGERADRVTGWKVGCYWFPAEARRELRELTAAIGYIGASSRDRLLDVARTLV
jgi:hypothetical protein